MMSKSLKIDYFEEVSLWKSLILDRFWVIFENHTGFITLNLTSKSLQIAELCSHIPIKLYTVIPPPKILRFYWTLRFCVAFFELRKDFRHGNILVWNSIKYLRKITVWVLVLYFIGHIESHSHSNIQLVPLELSSRRDGWGLRSQPLWRRRTRRWTWRFYWCPRPLFWRLVAWYCPRHWFPRSLAKNFVLIAFFLWLRLVHFAKILIVLLKPSLKSSQAHSQARLVDFVVDCFVQDRKIWFQWFEVLDVSNPKLRWFLVKIRVGQPRGRCKRAGINKWLLRLTRSVGRSCAHGIWNNSWFANGRLSKFELPSFQNGFQFNCHFGLRLDFGLDTLHYPLQHRPRFCLGFFMRFHVRLQRTCVPATLVTSVSYTHLTLPTKA